MAGRTTEIKLDFVFKPDGFILDIGDEWKQSKDSGIIKQFYEDKYLALYNMGLGGRQERAVLQQIFYIFLQTIFSKGLQNFQRLKLQERM